MKLRPVAALLLSLILACLPALRAQEAKPAAPTLADVEAVLDAVIQKAEAKLAAKTHSAGDFAPEIKELDDAIKRFAADKELAARVAFAKAVLYAEMIGDRDTGRQLLEGVTHDYPGTTAAGHAEEFLNYLGQSSELEAVNPELQPIVERITAKARAGSNKAADFAAEIAMFDALLAKYAKKAQVSAYISLSRAMFYARVLNDSARSRELLKALIEKYPGTAVIPSARESLAELEEAAAREAQLAALVGKAAPELHFKWASKDGLKTLSSLKGQVVVLDFWATWCGPCIASFPQIRKEVAHFKGLPVSFVGVTSIQGRVSNLEAKPIDTRGDEAKELSLLPQFMKAKEMTWDVAVSEEEVFNPAYGIEGIPYLAIIAPDGTVRHAGLHPGDPSADVAGKIEAILKEFKLPVPKA